MSVRQLNTADPQFEAEFSKLVARDASVDPEITRRAEAIVEDVRVRGDEAVLEYTNRFDRMSVSSMDELVITAEEMKAALDGLPAEQREALTEAAERIRKFHEEVVLNEQFFIMDDKKKVKEVVAEAAKEVGAPVELKAFARFALGEGIEKKEEDFAAEVAAAAGK